MVDETLNLEGEPERTRTDITGLRATLKEEEADVQTSREKGLDFVNELFMATRTFAIHDPDNKATEYPIQRLVKTIRSLIEAIGSAQFIVAEGESYINDVRIRVEARNYGNLQHVIQLMGRHALGGITFSRSLAPEQAKALVIALNERPDADDPLGALRAAVDVASVPVGLEPPFVQATDDVVVEGTPAETEGTAGYATGIAALKDYADVVVSEGFANPLKVRRAVQDLIDLSADDVSLPLKLQAIQAVEDPFFNHSVNVANLSIAVGKALGLNKVHLRELGVAAIFHDVGYAYLQSAKKDDPEYERKREENRQLHPITGVMLVANEKGYQPHKARRMRVALEHHLHFRRPGGYPPLFTNRLGIFTRIVQVCDHYDAMVAPEPDTERSRFLPAHAMRKVLQGSGIRFDPVVVKGFVRVMGRHPYGSLVMLNTRQMAIVMGGGRPGEGFKRPCVRLIRERDGTQINEEIDLLEPEHQDKWIVRALDPAKEKVDVIAYLFGEYSAIGELMEGKKATSKTELKRPAEDAPTGDEATADEPTADAPSDDAPADDAPTDDAPTEEPDSVDGFRSVTLDTADPDPRSSEYSYVVVSDDSDDDDDGSMDADEDDEVTYEIEY